MSEAIVLGHSHSDVLARALGNDRSRWTGITIHRLEDKRAKEGAVSIPAAMTLVKNLPSGSILFLSVLGAYHNLLGLLRTGADFDVLLDPGERPNADAVIVPRRAMESAIGEQFSISGKFRTLIGAASCPVFVIAPPPPKKDNRFILERFMRQKKRIYRGRAVEDFGVERPAIRLKLWCMEMQLLADWTASLGASFVPAPRDSMDPDGFLKEDYYGDDVTHASDDYGALVLDQVTAIQNGSAKRN